jgi:hypothetical protein
MEREDEGRVGWMQGRGWPVGWLPGDTANRGSRVWRTRMEDRAERSDTHRVSG